VRPSTAAPMRPVGSPVEVSWSASDVWIIPES
jgi:hypothetical protein